MADTRSPGGRHKSKQALRDYQKVLVQLESLEIGVGDQCRKEFTGGAGGGAGLGWQGEAGAGSAHSRSRAQTLVAPGLQT